MIYLQWQDKEDRKQYHSPAPDKGILDYARAHLFSGRYIKLKEEKPVRGIYISRHWIIDMYENNYKSYAGYIRDCL